MSQWVKLGELVAPLAAPEADVGSAGLITVDRLQSSRGLYYWL